MTETFVPLRLPNGQKLDVLGDTGEDLFGRMPEGADMDPSEFDALPTDETQMTPEDLEDDSIVAGDAQRAADKAMLENDLPPPFVSPAESRFPMLLTSLRHFRKAESEPRVVRVDTDRSYGDFVCEAAVRELTRRMEVLEAQVAEHAADPDAHRPHGSRQEILGAAQAVANLRRASTTSEATAALPAVPVDLPPFAQGQVKCWKDGENVVCSMRFQAADGKPRTATMAAKPRLDAPEVLGAIARSGVNPIRILGILPDLAEVACGQRLVREVAGAALQAQRRADVVGMEEDDPPVLLATGVQEGSAPLAAVMHLQQACEAGDPQACKEMAALKAAAATPNGERIAGPLLAEAHRRLTDARSRQVRKKPTLMERYAAAAGWV